ncbi:ABC transporter permease [Halobacterium wangiae]|uniref:ABC transporter permease n=1 Tax=Halobacterium wangiae TaxID=2902623 RepID=UPI001E44E8D7|nr:ABC transporter permease subunit [Halobacterium wangiae]
MSLRTVARDDFTNARRSYVVLGVVGVLTALVALIFVSEITVYDHPYRALFDVSFFMFLVFPIILAPLTYLAIAGDRDSGAIKYVMGLPNTRTDYVLGKFASRFAVAVAAVVLAVAAGFLVALLAFVEAPGPARFAAFAGVSLLAAFAFVGIYVGISAVTNSRSRAMLGVFGAYFLLVPFWFGFLPVIGLPDLLNTVADVLGTTISEDTQQLVRALSPATSYLYSTQIVYQGLFPTPYDSLNAQIGNAPDKVYAKFWFNALVMFVWGAGSMLVGYLSFRRSELG